MLGRGTDFPSSLEIETNGGNYIILGDVFDDRITQQIKGRVSRMQNQGQFQYIVYMKQGGQQHNQKSTIKNVQKLDYQNRVEQLLNAIRKTSLSFGEPLKDEEKSPQKY